jgi:hypothetical protein
VESHTVCKLCHFEVEHCPIVYILSQYAHSTISRSLELCVSIGLTQFRSITPKKGNNIASIGFSLFQSHFSLQWNSILHILCSQILYAFVFVQPKIDTNFPSTELKAPLQKFLGMNAAGESLLLNCTLTSFRIHTQFKSHGESRIHADEGTRKSTPF